MRKTTILILMFFVLLFSAPQAAAVSTEELRSTVDTEAVMEALPDETKELLRSSGISPRGGDPKGINRLLQKISTPIKEYIYGPFRALALLMIITVISRIFTEIAPESAHYFADLGCSVCAAGILLQPAAELLQQTMEITAAINRFMLAAVPVYCSILVCSGKPLTGSAYGTVTLSSANVMLTLCEQLILPVVRVFLAFSVMSAVVSFDLKRICESIYKGIKWALVFGVSLFCGVLSLQTMLSAQTDNITGKAAKMVSSAAIPIVGSAFADAMSLIGASTDVLRSGAGAFGVLAICAILLPLSLRISCWILICRCSVTVSELFQSGKLTTLAENCASALKLMNAVIFSAGAAGIISAAFLLCVRGAYG